MGKQKVLIVGAGVAGLTCALWLEKSGFSPVVIERADTIRGGGFLVSLSHHAYQSAARLGLMDEIEARGCGIRSSGYYDPSGRSLLELDYPALFGGVELVQIMRDELVDILYTAAKEKLEIRFNQTVTSLTQDDNGVDVNFASGKKDRFDLVIGADGSNSLTRRQIFEPSQVIEHQLGLMCAAYTLPNVLGLTDRFETHMRRDRYMATFSSGRENIGAVFIWDSEQHSVPRGGERRELLLEQFVEGDAATLAVLGQCPTDRTIFMDRLKQIELPQWHQQRVVLVGDAAHSLTPFSGRGAAAALNGATRLAQALAELPVDRAITQYQQQMRPVIDDIQPATRRAVRWYVPRSAPVQMIRDNAMRLLPNALFRKYFQYKYSNI